MVDEALAIARILILRYVYYSSKVFELFFDDTAVGLSIKGL